MRAKSVLSLSEELAVQKIKSSQAAGVRNSRARSDFWYILPCHSLRRENIRLHDFQPGYDRGEHSDPVALASEDSPVLRNI